MGTRWLFWALDTKSCSCHPHLLACFFHTDPWKVSHDSLPLVLMLPLSWKMLLTAQQPCLYMWWLVMLVTEKFSVMNPKTMLENSVYFRDTVLWHCFHILILEQWLIRPPYLTGKFSIFHLTWLCISAEKLETTSSGFIFPFLNKTRLPMTQKSRKEA